MANLHVIQKEVQNVLAKHLLRGDFELGSTILGDVDEQGDLTFGGKVFGQTQDS